MLMPHPEQLTHLYPESSWRRLRSPFLVHESRDHTTLGMSSRDGMEISRACKVET